MISLQVLPEPILSMSFDEVLFRNHGCAVYYLFDDRDRLIYVGQSKNQYARIGSHQEKPWERVGIRHVPDDLLDLCESIEIRRYRPIFNLNLGPLRHVVSVLCMAFDELPAVDFVITNRVQFCEIISSFDKFTGLCVDSNKSYDALLSLGAQRI